MLLSGVSDCASPSAIVQTALVMHHISRKAIFGAARGSVFVSPFGRLAGDRLHVVCLAYAQNARERTLSHGMSPRVQAILASAHRYRSVD